MTSCLAPQGANSLSLVVNSLYKHDSRLCMILSELFVRLSCLSGDSLAAQVFFQQKPLQSEAQPVIFSSSLANCYLAQVIVFLCHGGEMHSLRWGEL